jgi:hypothetical protein
MAVDPDTVDDALTDLVAAPKSITTDAGSITEHSIADLLELQKQAAANNAVATNTKTRGLRFNKVDHRGTQG